MIPVDSSAKALILGMLWGWLPCGLVYSTLTWSIASGSALDGALIMLFFGLGTLPMMLSLSLGGVTIRQYFQHSLVRNIAASAILCFGIYTVVIASFALF